MTQTVVDEDTFCQEHLAELNALQFKSNEVQRLLNERCDLEDDFHRHLLSCVYDTAVAFDAMMKSHGGEPVGVEYKHKDRSAWSFVLPDVSEPGRWRLQYFDESGFYSHQPYDTVRQAAEALASEGFRVIDAGALDRMSELASWKRGTEVAGLIQKLNSRAISFEEFNRQRALL